MTQTITSYSVTVKHFVNGKGAITSEHLTIQDAIQWLSHWPHAVAVEIKPNLTQKKGLQP